MSTTLTTSNEKPLFELKEVKNDKIVFQRVIRKHNGRKKVIQKRIKKLPTATVYAMSKEDFNRLKTIEAKLLQTDAFKLKPRKSLKEIIFTFFEI